MSDQPYSTPASNVTQSTSDIQLLLTPLITTKFWVRLCSIMGFISTVFMLIAGVGVLAVGSLAGGAHGANTAMPILIGILYIVFSALYFFPSLFLAKYASSISAAQESMNVNDIVKALDKQKSFWKFAGITVLVMLGCMLLGILGAIMIPILGLTSFG